ncbi:MAG: PAS domain-containing protein, partial [Wenzhouxiangellaceae bacterium]
MEAIDTRAGAREAPETGLDSILFEHLFEQSPDAIVLLDESDRVVRINPAFEQLFGYRQSDCHGRTIAALIVDKQLRHEARAVSRQVLEGNTVRFESLRKARDGRRLQVEISGVPIRTGRGRVGIFGIYRDVSDRRDAEKLLAHSESRYRRIVESLIDGYFELDLEGRLVFGNKALARMLGEAGRPGAKRFLLQRLQPRWRRPVMRQFLRLLRDDPGDGALAFDALDGADRVRCYECMVSVIRTSKGLPTGFRGTLRDVSRRVRADAEIADKEAAYRSMALSTGQLVYEYDTGSGRIQWLGALRTVLGVDKRGAEGVGIDEWTRRVHPDDRDRTVELLTRAVRDCGDYRAEYRFQRHDGDWIDVIDRGAVLAGDADRAPRLIGTMTDVTQRNREQAALAEARMQAQVTLDSISDAVIRIGDHGCVEYLNPSARRLIGLSSERALGRPLREVLSLSEVGDHDRTSNRERPLNPGAFAHAASQERHLPRRLPRNAFCCKSGERCDGSG